MGCTPGEFTDISREWSIASGFHLGETSLPVGATEPYRPDIPMAECFVFRYTTRCLALLIGVHTAYIVPLG